MANKSKTKRKAADAESDAAQQSESAQPCDERESYRQEVANEFESAVNEVFDTYRGIGSVVVKKVKDNPAVSGAAAGFCTAGFLVLRLVATLPVKRAVKILRSWQKKPEVLS